MHATRSGFVTGMYSIALPCYLDLLNLQQCTRLHWVTVMQEGLAIEEECRKYHCNVISLENLLRDLLHLWKGVSYPSLVSDPVRVGQRSISRTMKWELRTFRMAVLRRRFTGKMATPMVDTSTREVLGVKVRNVWRQSEEALPDWKGVHKQQ